MAKSKSVRHPRRGVSEGSSQGRPGKKPKPVKYPEADFWFHVVIAGHSVPIFVLDDLPSDDVGEFIPTTMEIYLDRNLPKDLMGDTIFHEILHVISNIYLTPEQRLNETQVNTLATQLRDTINRNPVLRWGVR